MCFCNMCVFVMCIVLIFSVFFCVPIFIVLYLFLLFCVIFIFVCTSVKLLPQDKSPIVGAAAAA